MRPSVEEVKQSKSIVVVRRIDVVLMVMIIALMIVFYHWIVAFRQLQYEKQVNAELVETKAELAEALAVQKIRLNRRIGVIEQIVVDKKFIENWGEFIREIEQYQGKNPDTARMTESGEKMNSAKGSGGRQAAYITSTY